MLPRLEIDWDEKPEPPDWLVDRMFVKGQLTLLAAFGGGAKTLLAYALSMCVAAFDGVTAPSFIGREVHPHTGRVLIVDAEGDVGEIASRLKALGMSNEQKGRLYYALEPPHPLGTELGDAALCETVEKHRPDLVVIDSISALAPGNLNDNEVALSMMRSLKALRSTGAAVIALAHESKPARDGQSATSRVNSIFGSVQWVNQSDAAFALTPDEEVRKLDDRRMVYALEWECVRSRAGLRGERGRLEVRSKHGPRGERLWMGVAEEGSAWPKVWDFTQGALA